MNPAPAVVALGEFIAVTCDEYSDYGLIGVGQAQRTFDVAEAITAFDAKFPRDEDGDFIGEHEWTRANVRFGDFLFENGLLKKIPLRELNIAPSSRRIETKLTDLRHYR